ncbi:MAG: PfkB family carbohydrate kinase [Bacteroidota bacterium]
MNEFTGLFVGLTTIDIQYFVDSFPTSNKKVKTTPPVILTGGPATNAAVAFSYLNNRAFLATSVGSNSFSAFIKNDLKLCSLKHFDLIENQPANVVLASVVTSRDNGDRTIFTHHPEEIKPEITPAKLLADTNPDILMLDGFYPEFSTKCAQIAKDKGIAVVLDCGSWKPQFTQLIPLADVAICSSDFLPPHCNNENQVFDYLHKNGIKNAAISRGGSNLLYSDGQERGAMAVEKVAVKDTLGAGDFLHGAFCYYYLNTGFNFKNALKHASKLASFTCRYPGTRDWLKFGN